jgi:hypothetical protein
MMVARTGNKIVRTASSSTKAVKFLCAVAKVYTSTIPTATITIKEAVIAAVPKFPPPMQMCRWGSSTLGDDFQTLLLTMMKSPTVIR